MSESENGNELGPEKCLERLRELDSQREDLIRRQAAMVERHDSAQRELVRITEQMKAMGTSPQTIQADLALASKELRQKTVEYEKSLGQLSQMLNEGDAGLIDVIRRETERKALEGGKNVDKG